MKDTTFTCNSVATSVQTQMTDKGYKLGQNRPNPAVGTTSIAYTIPEDCNVTLWITSITGTKVAEPVHQMQSAGNYQIDVDVTKLPKGIYFYTIIAGQYTETKKMEVR